MSDNEKRPAMRGVQNGWEWEENGETVWIADSRANEAMISQTEHRAALEAEWAAARTRFNAVVEQRDAAMSGPDLTAEEWERVTSYAEEYALEAGSVQDVAATQKLRGWVDTLPEAERYLMYKPERNTDRASK